MSALYLPGVCAGEWPARMTPAGRRVLVCGSRQFEDRALVVAVLTASHASRPFAYLCAGDARGPDKWALEWAASAGVPTQVFVADWETNFRAAGPLRLLAGRPGR